MTSMKGIRMKTSDMLAEYNRRVKGVGGKTLGAWSKSKSKELLQARIDALPEPQRKPAAKGDPALEAKYDAAVARVSINPADPIAVASEKLLTAVAFEHEGRRWGIPYARILAEVKRTFPDCETTVACLRWYAVDLNKNGVRLPHRKRSKQQP
jgi:hypothetical protein